MTVPETRRPWRRRPPPEPPPPPLHDGLTGLPGRAWLEARLDQALARTKRHGGLVAVLLLDLDGFASVNRRMGHEWGDRVLVQVGRRLVEAARAEDTTARMDGDQFAVLLEQVADENAPVRVARRIIESFRAPVDVDGNEAAVSLSIGVAVCRSGARLGHELVGDATLAMRRAKKNGRGGFEMFDAQLGRQVAARMDFEARMREAATEGELVLHYQPEVRLGTGEIVGAEALVRWHHPTRGLLPPEEFIAIAEETGLIVPIGRWVLREACQLAARLEHQGVVGHGFRMSVNVSVRQLQHDPDFLEETALCLAESGLAPERLVLELTETLQEIESLAPALRQLRAMGVGVALDDFGTGYSSLARLASLPVSVVKVDQRFVHGIAEPANLAIVRSVASLANVLGMEVTAEGIETARQLELVRAAGCDRGQGFHFSEAVTEAELPALLQGVGYRPTSGAAPSAYSGTAPSSAQTSGW